MANQAAGASPEEPATDGDGLIYSADRAGTGLHIIRLTGHAAEIVAK